MAYTFVVLQTQTRANINDSSASVTQVIDDAINYLSSFFSLRKIDTSKSTVIGQAYIAKPTNAKEIEKLKIGDTFYDKISLSDFQDLEENEEKGWYEYNDQIRLTFSPTAVETCTIWYTSGFTALAGAGSTDVPDRLAPIIPVLAAWFYWLQMLAKISTARENYPDISPEEATKVVKEWKEQFDKLLQLAKNQR